MAFNDLTAAAQEGLNYLADINKRPDGTPYYATGRLYADAQMETLGQQGFIQKIEARRAARAKKLEDAANAALAATVDALPDPK